MMTSSLKSIKELSQELCSGRTQSRNLVNEALAKIEDKDGEGIRTMLKVHAELARATADNFDSSRKLNIAISPIAGLPITVKDLFDIAGDVTTAGSKLLQSAPPAVVDAPVIQRLRRAGAIIIGRTNMTEFAYSGLGLNPHYDTPRNPWDRKIGRIPGGASSGAAVSVTDKMAVAAIGTDTGGSVRIPSALCGITGFKPTACRISRKGVYPLSHSLDSIGPLAPTVECCAILDAVMAGKDPVSPLPFKLKGLRLGVPQTLVLDDLDKEVSAAFWRTLDILSKAGANILDIKFSELAQIPKINARGGIYAEAYAVHRKQLASNEQDYDPRVASRILRVKQMDAADYFDVLRAREDIIERSNTITANFDAVVMPTTPLVAPPIKDLNADEGLYTSSNILMLRNTFCFNFLDRCALSIPMHLEGEPPTGLMVVGETMEDQKLLSIGLAIEDALQP